MIKNDFINLMGYVGKNSGGDFTIAFASATTLTLGTLPDGSSLTADDVLAVMQFSSTGKHKATYEGDERTMSMSGNVLTVAGASFVDGDVYAIYTNIARVDANGNIKVTEATLGAGEDQDNNLLGTIDKPVSVDTYSYAKDVSSALEASSISKATGGNLYRAFGAIDAGAATDIYYIQFLDSVTLPANGAVTHIRTPLVVNHTTGTDTEFDTGHMPNGVQATSGIVIVASTTLVTKTIAGSVMFATTLTK